MDIKGMAYELYKLYWVEEHVSIHERASEIKRYYKDNCFVSFEEWILINGYNGSIYVSYDEFLDNEYQDEAYMKEILQDEELINLYLKDRK